MISDFDVKLRRDGYTIYINDNMASVTFYPRDPSRTHQAVVDKCAALDKSFVTGSEALQYLEQSVSLQLAEIYKSSRQRQRRDLEDQPSKEETAPQPVELSEDVTREITFIDVGSILESSIKKDDAAKLITFCGMLLAQTENDQVNVGFQSKSSTGKSYIPIELSAYFSPDEVIKIASASPTAFFHERGQPIFEGEGEPKKLKHFLVDLEGKILIFLDQQHFQLLEKMRGILSHDEKELTFKITDKSAKMGLKTKTVLVRGFPSVFYCTTSQSPDEQEKTRLILLSASIDQDKLQESIKLLSLRKGNSHEFAKQVSEHPGRAWLVSRIKGIRQTGIREVIIPNHEETVCQRFLKKHQFLMPRHQRDFPRIMSLIKAHALLNVFHREKVMNGHGGEPISILARQDDIDAGFALYEKIADSNERGLSPYVYGIFETVIKPLGQGVKREEVQRKYYEVYHEMLSAEALKREILPQLETVGFIVQEPDPDDKRRLLIYSTVPPPIISESNRGEHTGVNLDTVLKEAQN